MKLKKLAAFGLTTLMAISMTGITAFAADITVDGTGNGYNAYRLLNLTTSLKADHAEHAGAHENDCYNYAYTVNPDYRAMLQSNLGNDADTNNDGTISDAEILNAVENMTDADAIRTFADKMFKSIEAGGKAADVAATLENGKMKFVDAPQGYYLISESQRGEDPDAVSLVLLDTAGQDDLTVKTKEGVPTLTKKIVLDDGSLVDADTVAKGDTVNYQLTITMPENIENFETYKLIVHDDIQGGLSLADGNVSAKVGDANVTFEKVEATDGCELELLISDIKAAVPGINKDSVLVIDYSCLVTDDVVMGSNGNVNVAKLEFSADPYHEDEPGNTTEDKNVVFSFGVKVTKVDSEQNPLGGADFKLQKFNDEKGAYEDYLASGVTAGADVSEFNFTGLDEGKYRLVETTVPAGYVEADPVDFEITADYELISDNPALNGITIKDGDVVLSEGEDPSFTVDLTSGISGTKVINIAGKRMPTTGGAGTMAIYVGGAVLVIAGCGAAVMKKRSGSKSK